MKRALVSLLALPLALAAACARTDDPIDPAWGKQPCAHCAMVLSDKHFGAEIVTSDGERVFFDDVGCMVLFLEEAKQPPKRAWVHDAQTGQWLDARTAHYGAASSPMDFGFEARASADLTWDEMRSRVLAKKRSTS
jgi:copper chaperone NosL